MGRYDVMMEPCKDTDDAVILEFKVYDPEDGERTLEDTVKSAGKQNDEIYGIAEGEGDSGKTNSEIRFCF